MTDPWRNEGSRPSVAIRQLARICSGLSLKGNPILHIAMHVLVPWDLAWTWHLQKVCNRLRPVLPNWILHLAIIDAAMALATFAYLNPSYAWPRRRPEGNATTIGIAGTAIGHPLIAHEQRVNNDLTLEGLGRGLPGDRLQHVRKKHVFTNGGNQRLSGAGRGTGMRRILGVVVVADTDLHQSRRCSRRRIVVLLRGSQTSEKSVGGDGRSSRISGIVSYRRDF